LSKLAKLQAAFADHGYDDPHQPQLGVGDEQMFPRDGFAFDFPVVECSFVENQIFDMGVVGNKKIHDFR
jgi:hypothetical protein